MRRIIKGGKEYVTIEVTRNKPDAYTIDAATYKVLDARLQEIGDDGPAFVDEKLVFMLLDTTQAIYTGNTTYYVQFAVTITGMSKILKHRVPVFIVE